MRAVLDGDLSIASGVRNRVYFLAGSDRALNLLMFVGPAIFGVSNF